jgi:GT2 family glycosyltransferase
MSVAEKWNEGLNLAKQLSIPAVFLNDDIIPWPGTIDEAMLAVNSYPDADILTGVTTKNLPANDQEPDVFLRGGFSFFAVRPETIKKMADWECQHWQDFDFERRWPGYIPGFFDVNFRPAYYEDSDWYWRSKLAGLKEYVSETCPYYHEMVVKIASKQGKVVVGCTTNLSDAGRARKHEDILRRNSYRFMEKWGGPPHEEKFKVPWNMDASAAGAGAGVGVANASAADTQS